MPTQKEQIESLLILAKGKSGSAVEMVLDRALSQPQIFVFGEFLALQNVKAVSNSFFKLLRTCNLARSNLKASRHVEPLCVRYDRRV